MVRFNSKRVGWFIVCIAIAGSFCIGYNVANHAVRPNAAPTIKADSAPRVAPATADQQPEPRHGVVPPVAGDTPATEGVINSTASSTASKGEAASPRTKDGAAPIAATLPTISQDMLEAVQDAMRNFTFYEPLLHVLHELIQGENKNLNAAYGWRKESPLHLAASLGNVDIVKALLERGASINQLDAEGHSPLYRAAYDEQEEILDYLLGQGADKTIRDKMDQTPYECLQQLYGSGPISKKARRMMDKLKNE